MYEEIDQKTHHPISLYKCICPKSISALIDRAFASMQVMVSRRFLDLVQV